MLFVQIVKKEMGIILKVFIDTIGDLHSHGSRYPIFDLLKRNLLVSHGLSSLTHGARTDKDRFCVDCSGKFKYRYLNPELFYKDIKQFCLV